MRHGSITTDPEMTTDAVEALERRVLRLEQAVAALGDTQLMEDRVVERVAQRAETNQNGGLLSGASRLWKREKKPVSSPDIALEPVVEPAPAPASAIAPAGWLITEFIHELRTVSRMFGDYRYRMSWTGRIIPIVCIVLAVLSYFVVRMIPLVGWAIDSVIGIVLVVIVYKALSREVRRYHSGAGRR